MSMKTKFMARLRVFSTIFLVLMSSGCMAQQMKVDVVIFNYMQEPIGNITIQGHYIGGYYEGYDAGGTGGKSYCCIVVESGPALVEWTYGGSANTPNAGTQDKAKGVIPKLEGEPSFLGIHLYSSAHVEYTLTSNWPVEKQSDE